MRPTKQKAWKLCQKYYKKTKSVTLDDLIGDKERGQALRYELGGLSLDLSRTHLSKAMIEYLVDLAEVQQLEEMREALFVGKRINHTEDRAVLHTALRAGEKATPLSVDGQDVRASVDALHVQMKSFVEQVRSGAWKGATGKPIQHIVNIGIGGSDLGPRLVSNALRSYAIGPSVHYIANIDGAEVTDLLKVLDPAETLFLIVSKTFTTQETLTNAKTARKWLTSHLGDEAVAQHFVAVSVAKDAVKDFGIDEQNMFPMWDWVGGRYSVWSAVGLSVALSVGWDHFQAFLSGASIMDDHFQTAPFEKNMPVMMALAGIWYRNFWGTSAEAVLPYNERLRDLPRFLQQLNMESNGKSVDREGESVDYHTGPIIFGECGTVGQHSFHQWLHQGTDVILSEFIGVKQDAYALPEHHEILNAHMEAQMQALQSGRQEEDLAKTNAGNKPSIAVWLDQLDPCHLGMLLALYEHKVFVQGVIWNINSFDQYGVQLGKLLAADLMKA